MRYMKLNLFLIFSLYVTSIHAQNWLNDNVPGTDMTYRQFYYYRNLNNNMNRIRNPEKVSGPGVDFRGSLKIETDSKKNKKYFVFIRNCGKVELQIHENIDEKRLRSGTPVVLKMTRCNVLDWNIY